MPLPLAVQHPIQSVIQGLLSLQTPGPANTRRYYSYLFRDLPDRHQYADYYILIKEPRSLHGVLDSIKKGIYSSPLAVAYDLFLVWSNAREYNQQGSMVYNDADTLEAHMKKLWNEQSPSLPPFGSLPRPGFLDLPPPPTAEELERKAAKRLKLTLKQNKHAASPSFAEGGSSHSHSHHHSKSHSKSHKSSSKHRIHVSLGNLPAPVASTSASTSAPAPTPTPTPTITLKFGAPRPPAPAQTLPPPLPPPPPIQSHPTPTSITIPPPSVAHPVVPPTSYPGQGLATGTEAPAAPRKESKESKKARKAKEKAARLAAKQGDGAGAEPLPTMDKIVFTGIPDEDPGWMSGDMGPDPTARYLDIVQKLRDHTDSNGRHLATPLLTLPDRASRQDYYNQVPNPIALDVIEGRARAGQYATPEAFDRDLHHLFQVARLFIRPETPGNVYADLLVLQRLYQELTKRVSHLSPPKSLALSSLSSVSNGPGNFQPKEPGAGDGETKGQVTSRITLKDKIVLDGINFKGDVLRVGDWIHLLNPDNPAKPIIAQIFKVYKKIDSPQRCVSVCWYYRPEETTHPASRQFYEHEVFKTSNFIDHSIEDFIERCFVMFFTKYIRGRPKAPAWRPGMPIYVCEHRYKDEVKTFKKIKNWNSALPEEIRKHEYAMDLYPDERESLRRVKSPFVRGIAGPGRIGEAMENEEEEQAKYHFLPGNEPATAQRLKAVKEANDRAAAAAEAANPAQTLYGGDASQATFAAPPVVAAAPPPPAPILPPPPPVDTTSTPAELAAAHEGFHALPFSIQEKFRRNTMGDVLWFVSPSPVLAPVTKPHHSLEYMCWRAQRLVKENGGMNGGGDVEMPDAVAV